MAKPANTRSLPAPQPQSEALLRAILDLQVAHASYLRRLYELVHEMRRDIRDLKDRLGCAAPSPELEPKPRLH